MSRARPGRIGLKVFVGLFAFAALLVVAAWLSRAPIAADALDRELARRGVQASYRIAKIGLRTQRLENVVIGDPRAPELTADWAEVVVSTRWRPTWPIVAPGVTVRKITARGVRLNGRLVGGKLRLGQIDRLLPPPSGKPFAFPDFAVDLDRTTIRLATPAGVLGLAVRGQGRLSDGFRGRIAVSAPRLAPGSACVATAVRANMAIAITRRSPRVTGPVSAARVECARSGVRLDRPMLALDARVPESFASWRGKAGLSVAGMEIARGALSGVSGTIGFAGNADATLGALDIVAGSARFAEHAGRRLRFNGRYRAAPNTGRVSLLGDAALDDLALGSGLRGSLTRPLLAAAATPIAPLGTAAAAAVDRATRMIDVSGRLSLVHSPAGGAARMQTMRANGMGGARLAISGGEGLSYYWTSRLLRIDGEAVLSGGGLPSARLAFDQPRPGGLVSGTLWVAPYAAADTRLALAPVRFASLGGGRTRIATTATFDGNFNDGRVEGLTMPVIGQVDHGGSFAVNANCVTASWTRFQVAGLRLGAARVPLCPIGRGLLYRQAGGALRGGAAIDAPRLAGTLGQTPIRFAAADARFALADRSFTARDLAVRLGTPASLTELDLATFDGGIRAGGAGGRFTGAHGNVGNVPLLLTGGVGDWQVIDGDVRVGGGLVVADAVPLPRFFPLRADAARLTLIDNRIAATAVLVDPETGTKVSDVRIAHDLRDGVGGAVLDVPGIAFKPGFQPEALTRLTTGVVALVDGVVRGQGLINWNRTGVTSTGRFRTDDVDLAAAFGPVKGIEGELVFSDLLGLTTAPGQVATIGEINAGILVADGHISYQLLPGQRVRVEAGRWPYAGGVLTLDETIFDLGRPAPKNLTFRVRGMDAAKFVDQFAFENIAATGTFDGVVPMVFDEGGGRIVGGALTSREPGGVLAYVGILSDEALGTYGKLAFDALKRLRYSEMGVYLDGDLDGEFLSRFTINGRNQNERATGILKQLTGLPFKFNIAIRGQFRALLGTARSFNDPRDLIRRSQPLPIEGLPGTAPSSAIVIQPPASETKP